MTNVPHDIELKQILWGTFNVEGPALRRFCGVKRFALVLLVVKRVSRDRRNRTGRGEITVRKFGQFHGPSLVRV